MRRTTIAGILVFAGMAVVLANDIPPELSGYRAIDIVQVRSATDAVRLRRDLIRFIWKRDKLPGVRADVSPVPSDWPYQFNSERIERVQRLTSRLEYDIESHVYFVQAKNHVGCLLIYHDGHGERRRPQLRDSLLARVVNGGCDLLLAAMPLHHQNPPAAGKTRFGPLRLRDHDTLALLASNQFNPLKLFMQPVLAALNYAIAARGPYRGIFMAGLSGGGWTTTLYSALDTRITASFPVAGSLPLALSSFSAPHRVGDWEQIGSGLHRYADYLDLYLLATHPARSQIQMLNARDPCCFRGDFSRLYADDIGRLSTLWGGRFSVSVDSANGIHAVSNQHAQAIVNAMAAALNVSFPPPPSSVCFASRRELIALPIQNLGGHAYFVELPELMNLRDTEEHVDRSPVVVCENGIALAPAHSMHADIRSKGQGAFSHYGAGVIFSTSDNSDPNTNGRSYWIAVEPQ